MRFLSLKVWVVLCAFLFLSGFTVERFVENTHYRVIPGSEATATPEVVEFFSYGCPHCRAVEPDFEKWLSQKPENVKVVRIPAAWNPRFEVLARFYLTLDELGLAEKHSEAVFKAIHDEHKNLATKDDVVNFAESLGVDRQRFVAAYDGDKVSARLTESKALFARYRISGVPGFVVNGKYFTDVSLGGHGQELFDTINFLISKQ
jgi:thiol:disulfide interchange protein DsbA